MPKPIVFTPDIRRRLDLVAMFPYPNMVSSCIAAKSFMCLGGKVLRFSLPLPSVHDLVQHLLALEILFHSIYTGLAVVISKLKVR